MNKFEILYKGFLKIVMHLQMGKKEETIKDLKFKTINNYSRNVFKNEKASRLFKFLLTGREGSKRG